MTGTLAISPTEHLTIRLRTPELLEMEATYLPGARRPPKHWHPAQDEHFEVLDGTVRAIVGATEHRLTPGDTVDVPSRTAHQFWNPGTEPARVLWQVRPAGRTEQWFASLAALRADGARPGALALAVLLTEFRDVFRLSTPAAPLVDAALAVLAPLGRLRGHRPVGA
jgi:mannose-6-phosphate isomerase-like protein (cupin superfamily)